MWFRLVNWGGLVESTGVDHFRWFSCAGWTRIGPAGWTYHGPRSRFRSREQGVQVYLPQRLATVGRRNPAFDKPQALQRGRSPTTVRFRHQVLGNGGPLVPFPASDAVDQDVFEEHVFVGSQLGSPAVMQSDHGLGKTD